MTTLTLAPPPCPTPPGRTKYARSASTTEAPPAWTFTGTLHATVLFLDGGGTLSVEAHPGTRHVHLTLRPPGQAPVTGAVSAAQVGDLIAALDAGTPVLRSVAIPGRDVHALVGIGPDSIGTGHFTPFAPDLTRGAAAPLTPTARLRLAHALRQLQAHLSPP